MNGDWQAVARAITARLTELRRTQMDVATAARVSLTTLRELQHGTNERSRRPQTLSALSEALDWPPGHLQDVLTGSPTEVDELAALRARIERIEKHLGLDGLDKAGEPHAD